jgi:hypothetical protein
MAMFEAPVAHEASHYGNPYSNPEFEFEEELSHYSNPEASHYSNPYSNPELEFEFEEEAAHYSNPEASPYSNPEFEFEEEAAHYSNPELEFEDEISAILGPTAESEYEADQFFGRIRRAIQGAAKIAAPLAKRLAPFAARALAGIIPGGGAIAGPLAGKLVGSMVSEAEMEVAHMENQLLSMLSQEGEAEHPEVQEALMTEMMAGQAAAAESEAEAEAMLAATIPLTIRFMGAQRTMLPVTPALVQANARLVRTLRRQGPGGRQLLRLLPAIQRNTIAILRHLAPSQTLTTPTAVRAMSVATGRVMSNPQRTQRAIQRNMAMQVRATRTSRPRGTLPLRPSPRRQQEVAI